MSNRAKLASAMASVGVLALGWQVGTANGGTLAPTGASEKSTTGATQDTAPTPATATQATAAPASQSTGTQATQNAASASALKDGTYTGARASNRFGSVTVTITVAGGKLTNVAAASTANDNKSAMYNARALPTLKSATLKAQSATISTVSGATYTSRSYKTSLQSALDQARQ